MSGDEQANISIDANGRMAVRFDGARGSDGVAIDLAIADGAWREHVGDDPLHGLVKRIGVLPGGMTSGRDSVAIAVQLDDGRQVVAEMSYRVFSIAAAAMISRYGTP